jgi:chemotaxis response regulator CheB/predicted transcriptional regulator
MSALPSSQIRAGLIFQAVGLGEHLRTALSEVGVSVVQETAAASISTDTFNQQQIDVFVVNLDPELEDHLDDVADALDQYDRPVIYNDGAASARLQGWDQARWARHLAAKIKGELDANPPRPADALSIPMPAKKVAPKVEPKVAATLEIAPVAKVEPTPKPVPAVAAPSLPIAAPRLLPITAEIPAVLVPVAVPVPVPIPMADEADPFADLNFDFDQQDTSPSSVSKTFGSENSLDANALDGFDESAFNLDFADDVKTPSAQFDSGLDGLDSLLNQPAKPSEPAQVVKAAAPEKAAPAPTAKVNIGEKKAAPMSWSLEPLDGEIPVEIPEGRAKFVTRDVPPPPAVVLPKAPSAPAPKATAPEPEVLDDFDFFVDFERPAEAAEKSAAPEKASIPAAPSAVLQVAPAPVSNGDADLDDIFASFDQTDDVPMQSNLSKATPNVSPPSIDTADFEFDMDFDIGSVPSAESPKRDTGVQSVASEVHLANDDFADLDALFSDAPSAAPAVVPSRKVSAAASASVTGPKHVVVLGASIGGPEAVRAFLSKIKPGIGVGFVLAQHMGAEFLELMTGQLAKSTSLKVKLAKPGDDFHNGDVLVVPVNQRFMVGAGGQVEFHPLSGESPYSPSIDQIMFDMADRFPGRCTGIIFSGMASDAIEGANYMAGRGAKIWVQDPSTCVISSMIDGAQAAGIVSFVGAPEQLAEHLLNELGSA